MRILKVDIRMKWKIIIVITLLNLISIGLVSTISYYHSKKMLEELSIHQLEGVQSVLADQIGKYFEDVHVYTKLLTTSRLMEGIFTLAETSFFGTGLDIGVDNQIYVNSYKDIEEKFGERINELAKNYRMASIFLISSNGQIVFVSKNAKDDYFLGKNLISGEALKETQIFHCFNNALNGEKGKIFLSDYQVYKDGKVHAFMCSKKVAEFDHPSEGIYKGDVYGVVASEIDVESIEKTFLDVRGMGETGINYLVGHDNLLRSQKGKKSLVEFLNANEKVNGKGIDDALEGKSGKVLVENGKNILRIYGPIDFMGKKWGVISEKDEGEILLPVYEMLKFIFIISCLLFIVLFIIGFVLAQVLNKPLKILLMEIRNIINKSLEGDLKFRADSMSINEEFRPSLEGINTILDNLVKPIEEANDVLTNVANGNLAKRMNGQYKGDFASLKNCLNKGLSSIDSVLKEVRETVTKVWKESGHVAQSSEELSKVAVHQASSLEEISSSMNEIGGQTRQNSENADAVNNLSDEAKKYAESGNSLMIQLREAMDTIKSSSEDISKIINVIDEIAFQTNLLALNAAVEAARAGKHGKGFAVVAEEVRNLAKRSAEAAQETTALIDNSNDKVGRGGSIVVSTAEALDNIVSSVAKVSTLIQEIADSTKRQADGLTQIIKGVGEIDGQTQKTAATSEESAQASIVLKKEAEKLEDLIKKFTLS